MYKTLKSVLFLTSLLVSSTLLISCMTPDCCARPEPIERPKLLDSQTRQYEIDQYHYYYEQNQPAKAVSYFARETRKLISLKKQNSPDAKYIEMIKKLRFYKETHTSKNHWSLIYQLEGAEKQFIVYDMIFEDDTFKILQERFINETLLQAL